MSYKSKLILAAILALALFLRVYKLGSFPPGLYSDEAAYGYNAYSILQTARDEHGIFLPLAFKSFGGYYPPATAYLTVPTIAIFGLNEFALRLPSALFGTSAVFFIYLISKEIIRRKEENKYIKYLPETSAILLAISPWHIHFSRISLLAGIETSLIAGGFLFFLKSLKSPKFLYLSAFFFAASIYTYYGARVTAPLMLIMLAILFRKKLWDIKNTVVKTTILGLILISPFMLATALNPQTLLGRSQTTSVFFDQKTNIQLWEAHTLDGSNFPTYLSRFFHNKPYFYFLDITNRYLQHFSPDFLLTTGDNQPPFAIPQFGQIYFLTFGFFIIGLLYSIRNKTKKYLSILIYLFCAPFVASLTFLTPASNRAANMIVPLIILASIGLLVTLNWLNTKRINILAASFLIAVLFILSFAHYLKAYYVLIPQEIPESYHYGRKQLVEKVSRLEAGYKTVFITEAEGPTYIWLLFYKKYDPKKYWLDYKMTQTPDNLGWLHALSFDKYVFEPKLNWQAKEKNPDTLYVAFGDQLPDNWTGQIGTQKYELEIDDRVIYPNKGVVYKIGHLEKVQ